MATEGLVRPGLAAGPPAAQQAIDAFAGRHRYRLLEALPWAAAIALGEAEGLSAHARSVAIRLNQR